jgi:NodT family efflux transporter outer membrane factor (OMF) lipoprotein
MIVTFSRVLGRTACALLAASVGALGACAVGPNYVAPGAARLGVPDAYPHTQTRPAEDISTWWRVFQDPILTGLIERAAASNLDIAQSVERLAQARETLQQAKAGLLPTLTATTSGERQDVTIPGGPLNTSSGSLVLSWTADLFGGLRRNREASAASYEAAGFDLASVRTATAASIASDYLAYRTALVRLAIAKDTLKTQENNAEIAGFRAQAGLVSSLDVEQANAQRAQTAASLPPLRAAADEAEAALAVLIGMAPGALERELDKGSGLPFAPAHTGVGAPIDLLRRRPDVRSAERSLKSATALIGVAESQLYPQLTLQGQLGTPALLGVGMIGDSAFSAAIGTLSQTIFQGGALRSKVRAQEAATRGAFDAYKAAVLKALQDVANASAAQASAQGRAVAEAQAVTASEAAAMLARSQYASGLIDFQTLLTAEQSLLVARDGLVAARSDEAGGLIQLYLALGGGWPVDPASLVAKTSLSGQDTHG